MTTQIRTVTRDEVARVAEVSPATVSYVINNGPRPVATETRKRVLEVIERLGYKPNAIARNLRMQRSNTIGLTLPNAFWDQSSFIYLRTFMTKLRVCQFVGKVAIVGHENQSLALKVQAPHRIDMLKTC